MGISHACAGCGLELSGVRAPPDPIYSVPVVVCPRCKTAVVRVKPRVERVFRRARRAIAASFVLVVQGLLAFGFARMILTSGWALERLKTQTWQLSWGQFAGDLVSGRLPSRTGDFDATQQAVMLIVVFAGASIASGVWLTVGFAHLSRRRVALMWSALLMMGLIVPWALSALVERGRVPEPPFDIWPVWEVPALWIVIVSGVIALAGYPVGRVLLVLWKSHTRHRRAHTRTKRREMRMRAA